MATAALIMQACVASTTIMTATEGSPAAQATGRAPTIHSFTANPSNVAQLGQAIAFQVVATDPAGAALQFNWAATGGTLSSTTGQLVVWTPPEAAGTYSVQVLVTNASGGAASGSQSLIVKPDGIEIPVAAIATPAPAPSGSAAPAATAGASLVVDGYAFISTKPFAEDNGDEVLQRGENVILRPRLKNAGSSKTDGIKVKASTDDPYVELVGLDRNPTQRGAKDTAVWYMTIGPGESRQPSVEGTGFRMTISQKCPSGHSIPITLGIEDKYGNSWTAPLSITIP